MARKKPDKPGWTTPPRHAVRRPDKRLDQVLVERGFFPTRSQAAAALMAGKVIVDGNTERKAGRRVPHDIRVDIIEEPAYVSRGGYKLERALDAFDIDVAGRVALDAGASTGGFTDALLKNGAAGVIAVDVGYGQLDWKLRQDPRVEVMERTNVRHLDCSSLPESPSLATLDLSFISLKKVLPAIIKCLAPGYGIVTLIKPQFEAGKEKVSKGGVVRDPEAHREVLKSMWDFAESLGLEVRGLVESPVHNPKGNIEYLMYMIDAASPETLSEPGSGEPLNKDELVDEVLLRVLEEHHGRLFGREAL